VNGNGRALTGAPFALPDKGLAIKEQNHSPQRTLSYTRENLKTPAAAIEWHPCDWMTVWCNSNRPEPICLC